MAIRCSQVRHLLLAISRSLSSIDLGSGRASSFAFHFRGGRLGDRSPRLEPPRAVSRTDQQHRDCKPAAGEQRCESVLNDCSPVPRNFIALRSSAPEAIICPESFFSLHFDLSPCNFCHFRRGPCLPSWGSLRGCDL